MTEVFRTMAGCKAGASQRPSPSELGQGVYALPPQPALQLPLWNSMDAVIHLLRQLQRPPRGVSTSEARVHLTPERTVRIWTTTTRRNSKDSKTTRKIYSKHGPVTPLGKR